MVPVQLNEVRKCNEALVPGVDSVRDMSGGSVSFCEGVTLNAPPLSTSNERYCTVVPFIQLRTSVTDVSL